jgi:hypothetical protein
MPGLQKERRGNEMKNDGSAFPVLDSCAFEGGGSRLDCVDKGMTLRDYFAGQALPEATKAAWSEYSEGEIEYEQIFTRAAEIAYKIADAMLAEREKGE